MPNNLSSLNEIAYNLLNSLRGGRSSNTEHISLEQVKYMIKYYRAMFIRRDQERNFNRYRAFEQDLGILSVSAVNNSEYFSDNSDIYVIENKIPAPIRLKSSEAITFVGSTGLDAKPIPVVDSHRNYWNQYSKYTSQSDEAYYLDGKIYVKSEDIISEINVRGIFEDPEEVFYFANSNGIELYDENSPFPISADMLEGIKKGILQGELQLIATTVNDTKTDLTQDKQ